MWRAVRLKKSVDGPSKLNEHKSKRSADKASDVVVASFSYLLEAKGCYATDLATVPSSELVEVADDICRVSLALGS